LVSLAALRAEIGSLDRVRRIVKLVGFVNSAPGFTRQRWVVNGASDLIDSSDSACHGQGKGTPEPDRRRHVEDYEGFYAIGPDQDAVGLRTAWGFAGQPHNVPYLRRAT
jgi:hypothetical protein